MNEEQNNTDMIKVSVSNHAMERYAERILEKKDKLEIKRYITEKSETIITNIGKLVTYGKLIYTGKNPRKDKLGGTTRLSIYSKDSWIILVNPDTNNVITLFKKDLGLGDDQFNKEYVEKLLNRFSQAQAKVQNEKGNADNKNKELKEIISENEEKIRLYRSYIKQLEEANIGCKAIMESNYIKVKEAEEELNEILERIVTK